MNYVIEPAKRIPIRAHYDVVVVGGGIAGVAAAVAAAREKASVCLIEKEVGLGGLATLGNIIVYLPLCDGMGHQVSAGMAESLLKLSVRNGSHLTTPRGQGIPDCWRRSSSLEARAKQRYLTAFNPASYALELERLLVKSKVELLYDARFCAVHKRGNRIDAVMIEDKGGRAALSCGAVVDASGDADVCLAAGEEMAECRVNVPCGWFYYVNDNRELQLASHTEPFNADARTLPRGTRGFRLGDSRDLTALHLACNLSMDRQLKKIRRKPGNAMAHFIRPPSIASYRMTRRLVGAYELRAKDDRHFFDDTIGMIGHWRLRGPVYCVPFRSLYGLKTDNLVTAGRCISSDHDAWDITRVISGCAVTGEAAGAASAMLVGSRGRSFRRLDVSALQERLISRRVLIDRRLVENQGTQVDADASETH